MSNFYNSDEKKYKITFGQCVCIFTLQLHRKLFKIVILKKGSLIPDVTGYALVLVWQFNVYNMEIRLSG